MKNISCSLGRSSFGTLLVILLSFLVLSLPVQSCRLNQNVLAQASSMNQRGQSETNRLNLPDREVADKPSFKNLSPQSTIQNLSSTSIGDPQSKAEVIRKTAKLQMPFIANNGQTNERVKFYANTFGGTVFVTKDGEIVYALPNNSSDVETQCLASLMHSPSVLSPLKRGDKGVCNTTPIPNDRNETHPRPLPYRSMGQALLEGRRGVALKEQFVGAKVKTIQGEEKSVTKVNYFKGKDASKWKTDISTYETINLGEVYDGIELKLKAYGSNVEKLFCVKPGADPDQIRISLSGIQPPESPFIKGDLTKSPLEKGARGLLVNEHGELEVETELGPVKFTKPVAYQEINGRRVDVSVEYRVESSETENKSSKHKTCNSKPMSTNPKSSIQNLSSNQACPRLREGIGDPKSKIANRKLEYGFKVASYDKTKDLIIDPLLASTYLGGSDDDWASSMAMDVSGNVYVIGTIHSSSSSSDFPTTTDAYDTSYNGSSYDLFVSKLDGELTNLLASTYLGGGSYDSGYSLTLDTSGNVYVTGKTYSSDYPTTNGTYDTSYGGGSGDSFVSKLNSELTSLLASTFLGGSGEDDGYFLTLDTSGNVYVTGSTFSIDFPITSGAYDTSHVETNSADAFVSKFDGGLTSLLASTYIGGSKGETGYSLAIDTKGNVYATGFTGSSDFPTTSGVYDTSYNGSPTDVFISKLDSELTNLVASTFLGGASSSFDSGRALVIDTSGNVYVTGDAGSDFPTTNEAYDTSKGGVFVSKLDSGLTSLLASTFLGMGTSYSLAVDTKGNVFVAGRTTSSDYPTTSGVYDTSLGGSNDAFISKLNSGLTSLLASTFLGGSSSDYVYGHSLALDTSGNVYVAGYTSSKNFPTTSGAYDTSLSISGGSDVFVSKLDSDLSGTKPTATTGSATNVSLTSATLNGMVNANDKSTTAWFQYDTASGSYVNTSSTQTVTGTSDTTVSIDISGLSPATTYYYRIAAQSSVGTAYGNETSFATLSDTAVPTGSLVINGNAAYTNSPNVTVSLSATDNVGITAYYLSTSDSTPSATDTGWTSVTSTNSYSSNVSYTLSSGDGNKTVYVWFKDNSGNVSSTSSDSIILDTTVPTITITSPTSNTTYTVASSVIAVGGSASDSTSGISSVTWSNNKGGSGTASGTTSWLTSSVSLILGENIITVTATDGAGNIGTDTITVTFSTSTVFTPIPTLTPASSPTPILTPTTEPSEKCIISGYVMDKRGNPVESAKIRLKKANSRVLKKTFSDEDGFFEFTNLDADTYIITALKSGYKMVKQTITLEAGEEKDIEIVMKKNRRLQNN